MNMAAKSIVYIHITAELKTYWLSCLICEVMWSLHVDYSSGAVGHTNAMCQTHLLGHMFIM